MIKLIKSIIRDTLKKKYENGEYKWSRTSLTMFTAWILAIYMALYDMYKHGFNFEVFVTFVGVALGAKVTDAWSKKLSPDKNKQPEI